MFLIYDIFRFAFFGIFTGLHAVLMMGLFLEWRRNKRSINNSLSRTVLRLFNQKCTHFIQHFMCKMGAFSGGVSKSRIVSNEVILE